MVESQISYCWVLVQVTHLECYVVKESSQGKIHSVNDPETFLALPIDFVFLRNTGDFLSFVGVYIKGQKLTFYTWILLRSQLHFTNCDNSQVKGVQITLLGFV